MSLRVLISGGGTGGHIYPALAIADGLRRSRPDVEILFVGAEGKMEMERVPRAGYQITGLPVSALHRKLDARNLSFPFRLVRSLAKATKVVRRFRPDVAIGTGGFASGPALFAASMLGVPVFVQEQNAYPGATNRLLGKVAQSVFTAYTEADQYFASAKTRLTGNPLRSALDPQALPDQAASRQRYQLDPLKHTLLSFGGSLGSLALNEAHTKLTAFWRSHPQLQLIWQTGEGYYDRYKQTATAQLPNVHCTPYLEGMASAYAAAELVMCRAGALSIAELQLLGKAAILIPSPNVAGDHQTANARAVEAAGGAVVVTDDQLLAQLPDLIASLLQDELRLQSLSDNMLMQARPEATQSIVDQLLQHVGS